MNNLVKDISLLVDKFKNIYNTILVESVKNPNLRKSVHDINEIKISIENILVDLKNLDETNPNMFICYENNFYLSVSNGKYIISRKKEDKELVVIEYTSSLKKALEIFYHYSYSLKKKDLKKNKLL